MWRESVLNHRYRKYRLYTDDNHKKSTNLQPKYRVIVAMVIMYNISTSIMAFCGWQLWLNDLMHRYNAIRYIGITTPAGGDVISYAPMSYVTTKAVSERRMKQLTPHQLKGTRCNFRTKEGGPPCVEGCLIRRYLIHNMFISYFIVVM